MKRQPRLPKWIEDQLSKWSSRHGKRYLDLFKALEIAWAALHHYANTHDGAEAEKAMREIRRLGRCRGKES